MPGEPLVARITHHRKHPNWFDLWTLTHIAWGIVLVLFITPVWALSILVLWEPLEVGVLGPFLRRFGIIFGDEALKNSLGDIIGDVVGVLIGLYLVLPWFNPLPTKLF